MNSLDCLFSKVAFLTTSSNPISQGLLLKSIFPTPSGLVIWSVHLMIERTWEVTKLACCGRMRKEDRERWVER